MTQCFNSLARDEAGVTMTEYALMLLLVALACIGGVTLYGANLAALFAQEAAAI